MERIISVVALSFVAAVVLTFSYVLTGCASKRVKVKNCAPVYMEMSGVTVSECDEAEEK